MATRMTVKRTFLDFTEIIDDDNQEVGDYTFGRSLSDPALPCWRKEEEEEELLGNGEQHQGSTEAVSVASGGVEGGWSTEVESSDGDCSFASTGSAAWPAGGAAGCSFVAGDSGERSPSPQSYPWTMTAAGCADEQWQQGLGLADSSWGWGPWMWNDCGAPDLSAHLSSSAQEQPRQPSRRHRSRCRLSAKSRQASSQNCGRGESPTKGAAFSKAVRSAVSGRPAPKREEWTTVMMRNLPNNYSRDMLLELMDSRGFAGLYDFVYLPVDFSTRSGLGYAFVNLTDAATALLFWRVFESFCDWSIPSRKVCILTWSDPIQGLDANVERYRSSPVMCETVPDEFKPAIFSQGERVHFPAPLKKLRAPRLRKCAKHLELSPQQEPGTDPAEDASGCEGGGHLAGVGGDAPDSVHDPCQILCMIPVSMYV